MRPHALGELSVAGIQPSRPVASRDVALFLDVDGTLLDIADTPHAVFVPKHLKEALTRVERQLEGALALISGRTIEGLDCLFEPVRLRAAGVHGAQIRLHPTKSPQVLADVTRLPNTLAAAVKDAVRHFPGILVENKGFSIAVHYRRNPSAARWLGDTLQELLRMTSLSAVEIEEAHYAFELKPPNFDKGKAIALFLSQEPFRGRSPIFVGDDTTDEAGFAEVTARGGRAFSIGRPRPGVMGFFESPQSVRDWLAALARGEGE